MNRRREERHTRLRHRTLRSLYRKGWTADQIAVEFKVTKDKVLKYLETLHYLEK